MKVKPWTLREEQRLLKLYAGNPTDKLLKALPDRTLKAIEVKARSMRIKKNFIERERKKIPFSMAIQDVLKAIKIQPLEAMPTIKAPRLQKGKGDEEEIVLLLSDFQIGHKTTSFNAEVCKKRMIYLLKSFLKIVALHRLAYPIKTLNIFLLGDFIQSEAVGYLVDLSELEMVLIDQIYKVAVPNLTWLVTESAKNFEHVNVYCVRGNHGRGPKGSSEKTNWDDVIYRTLSCVFADNPRVKFMVASEFYQVVEIMGWRFLLAHGDQVRGGSYGIPLYALLQRMLRWAGSLPERWDCLCVGHWHSFAHLEQNEQELIVNGTLVSDDEYVRRTYGWNASTLQVMFGVHPRKGITGVNRLKLKKISL